MRKSYQIGALAAILGALVALGYWDEKKRESDKANEENEKKLVKADFTKIKTLVFQAKASQGSEPEAKPTEGFRAVLEKRDGKWFLVEPIKGEADEEAVQGIVNAVKDYKYDKIVSESKGDKGKYGLDAPNRTLEFVDESGGKTTLSVGEKAPFGYSVYSSLGDSDKIFIGSQYLLVSTEKKLTDLRNKSVVNITESNLQEIRFKGGQEAFTLSFNEGKASLVAPIQESADASEVRGLVDSLNRLRVEEFQPIEGAPKEFGEATPMAEWNWILKGGEKGELKLLKVKDSIWVSLPSRTEYLKVGNDAEQSLVKTSSAFRDRRMMVFKPEQVVEVLVDASRFKKEGDQWHPVAGAPPEDPKKAPEKKAPVTHVEGLLRDLEAFRAEDIVPPAHDIEAQAPLHALELVFKADSKLEPLEIKVWKHPTKTGKVYIKNSQTEKRFLLSDAFLSTLTAPPVASHSPPHEGGDAAPLEIGGKG